MSWIGNWNWRPNQNKAARRKDPFSVGLAILINFGAVSPFLATALGYAVIGAAVVGASLLASALQPKPDKPAAQDRQATVRQSVYPRWRYYGLNKVGGLQWFFESKDGLLYAGQTLNEGEISSINEIWLNDQLVTVDGEGYVVEFPYRDDSRGRKAVRVYFKMGGSDQTVHDVLDANFTQVTPDYRLRGVANCLAIFKEVGSDKIGEVYPQGNPSVRVVMAASLVKSVRTGARIYSTNPADCIYDYLTARDGSGFPYGGGFLESQIDLASFQAFANLCDEPVAQKDGSFAPRYTLNGGYGMNEEVRSVLARMCACCDADIYINGDGKMAIRGGKWVEPTLTLDSELGHIISGEFRQGQAALAAFNELTITYVEPKQGYVDTEAERWLDATNIALRGKVLSESLDLPMVLKHSQARRLAKIHTAKQNPLWVGTLTTNFYGFNALGEETVRVKFGPLGIDTTFLVQSVKILDDLTGVKIEVTSMDASVYAWDADLEEGDEPNYPPDTTTPVSLLPPEDITASTEQIVISGSTVGVRIVVTWTPPERSALSQQVQYRIAGSSDPWLEMTVSEGYAQSGAVNDGATYEYQVRTLSPGGGTGDWSTPGTIVAVSDTVPPAVVESVGATGGTGSITYFWTAPNSANYSASRLYWSTTNSFGTATLAATEFGSPNAVDSRLVTGISPGVRYIWVVAINGSGVAAAPVTTGPVTVS